MFSHQKKHSSKEVSRQVDRRLKKEEEIILAILKTADISIDITIQSINGVRLNDTSDLTVTNYDVNAKLEEKERKSGRVIIQFSLFVGTKPSLVKFDVGGTVILSGKDSTIGKILEIDPETKTPYILHKVYQRAFMAIFLLATILNMPYPPPNLLYSPKFDELFPEKSKESDTQNKADNVTIPPQQQNTVSQQQSVAAQKQQTIPQQQSTVSQQNTTPQQNTAPQQSTATQQENPTTPQKTTG